MEDISIFLGRFHPLVVHLPIGILLFAALLEVFALFNKDKAYKKPIIIALVSGGVFGLLAAGIGYLLSLSGGYDEATLSWHKWLGIGISIGAFLLALIKQKSDWDYKMGKIKLSHAFVLVLVIVLSITGHLGGNLTHGDSYLTEYMPSPLKSVFASNKAEMTAEALPQSLDSVKLFKHLINPILVEKCTKCHNPSKQKGALDLTSIAGIEKGGSSGATFIPNQIHESELLKRVLLPTESKKFMPPSGNEPLSPMEISIIKWWVSNGASFEKPFVAYAEDENMKFLLSAYLGFEDNESSIEIILPEADKVDSTIIAELESLKINVNKITQESNLLEVSFTKAQNEGRENLRKQFDLLQKIAGNIYKLDISNCGLENDDLAVVTEMKNLNFLRIERNKISDAGIQQLSSIGQLRYLNAYANPLTDQSIETVKKLNGLKKLNVWQTQITATALDELSNSKPDLEVISN